MAIELREISAETVDAVIALEPAPEQQRFVAPNAHSLARALVSDDAWYRGVWRNGELVGFVMLEDQSLLTPVPPKPCIGLWRLMVDRRFQGRGIGRDIVAEVANLVRARGFSCLYTSYLPGADGPEGFYLRLGFVPTGDMDGREIVAALPLAGAAPA